MNFSVGFWGVIDALSGSLQLQQQILQVEAFNQTELSQAIDQFNIILDKVYYFIPQDLLFPLIIIAVSAITIRLVFAIINLVWW